MLNTFPILFFSDMTPGDARSQSGFNQAVQLATSDSMSKQTYKLFKCFKCLLKTIPISTFIRHRRRFASLFFYLKKNKK